MLDHWVMPLALFAFIFQMGSHFYPLLPGAGLRPSYSSLPPKELGIIRMCHHAQLVFWHRVLLTFFALAFLEPWSSHFNLQSIWNYRCASPHPGQICFWGPSDNTKPVLRVDIGLRALHFTV
jgi:hypothetical protein